MALDESNTHEHQRKLLRLAGDGDLRAVAELHKAWWDRSILFLKYVYPTLNETAAADIADVAFFRFFVAAKDKRGFEPSSDLDPFGFFSRRLIWAAKDFFKSEGRDGDSATNLEGGDVWLDRDVEDNLENDDTANDAPFAEEVLRHSEVWKKTQYMHKVVVMTAAHFEEIDWACVAALVTEAVGQEVTKANCKKIYQRVTKALMEELGDLFGGEE